MKKFLFTLMALLMATTAMAESKLFIDDIPVEPMQLGTNIRVPVRAYFDGRVSGFQLDLVYPDGVTPVSVKAGADMTFPCVGEDGTEGSVTANLSKSNEMTRILGIVWDMGYWDPDGDGVYETYGIAKWEAGAYDEMIWITLHIDDSFTEGDLFISSKVAAGDDARGGTVPVQDAIESVTHISVIEKILPEPPVISSEVLDTEVLVNIVWPESDGEPIYTGEYSYPRTSEDQVFPVEAYVTEGPGYYESEHVYAEIEVPALAPAPDPVITFTETSEGVMIEVMEYTSYEVYVNGEDIGETNFVARSYDCEQIVMVQAINALDNYLPVSKSATYVLLPYEKQEVPAPEISFTVGETAVTVAIEWPESDGEQVYTGEYTYQRTDEEQVYTVEAYVTEGARYKESAHAFAQIPVPPVPDVPEPPTPVGNYLTIEDVEVLNGGTVTIPVHLHNVVDITAFQTDLYLPEGFELQDIVLTDRKGDHVLTTNNRPDGSVRILCYSMSLTPFTGNEGVLFNITVTVPELAAPVDNNGDATIDYTIELKKSLLTTAGDCDEIVCDDATGTVTVWTYIPGDVNGDGRVTITDVVLTASYILGNDPEPFIFAAADMNGDGEITVTDVVRIARLVLYPQEVNLLRAPAVGQYNDVMSADDIQLSAGETRTVTIALDNEADYTAFQFDMQLPYGLTASNYRLTDRAGSHTLEASTLSDGTERVMCYSPMLASIDGNQGALLTFELTATGEIDGAIMVDRIELVTTSCQTVKLDGFAINVGNVITSVREFGADVRIYAEGQNIIVESPVNQTVVISDLSGRAYSVNVIEGRNVIPARTDGVVMVTAGGKTAKLMVK